MFLYFQGDKINLSLQKLDDKGNQQLVIFWSTLVMKEKKEYTHKQFTEMFFHPTIGLLSSITEPRISEEIKRVLQMLDQVQIGDWYLYENYTEIRIFGCELPPYKLPKFIPMRIFSLEYIRQMINMDEIHFVAAKKKTQFKIKNTS